MDYAYLRVSRDGQDVANQRHGIIDYCDKNGLGPISYIEDKVSGSKDWRLRELGKLVDNMRAGDRLIASEFTRLARSTIGVLEILEVCLHRGIEVHVVKEGFKYDGSITSQVMATVFGLAGQIERAMISARTKEGLALRKAAGVVLGRPKGEGKRKLDGRQNEFRVLWNKGLSKAKIAKLMGVSPQTVTTFAKKMNLKREKP